MDPKLWELFESGAPGDEVSLILRLHEGAQPPANVRVVSSFGPIITVRARRADVPDLKNSDRVVSVKAGNPIHLPREIAESTGPAGASDEIEAASDLGGPTGPAPPALSWGPEDGTGVVVGLCDWGLDFTHANFRNADGTTRLEALWDQRGRGSPLAPAPFAHGRLLTRALIDAALTQPDPCRALGYHPALGDLWDSGSHGTHVADIAAGNRREPGSEVGLASGADIVFVHLSGQRLDELESLGDSVSLLEGLDFIRRQAAGRPCAINVSAGKTFGAHLGKSPLELAVDWMLVNTPGIVLVQSVGNYADGAMHTHARIGPDQTHVLEWMIPEGDRTPNALEIWYSNQDVFDVTLVSPDGQEFPVKLDERLRLRDGLEAWGNLYHRRDEPNTHLNHVAAYLYLPAPTGTWRVRLHGHEVVDGRLHAWIERDAGSRYQSRFPRWQATSRYTTNTICNCYRAIAVGAHDATRPERPPTHFSSRGPTADGRQKPEISAPGHRIRAARSLPRDGWRGEPRLVVKSGTSMAAPSVCGTVALMFQAAGRPLTIHEVRRILVGTADPHTGPSGLSSSQLGYGYLNVRAAVEAARRLRAGAARPAPDPAEEQAEPETGGEGGGWAPVRVEDARLGDM
jgi:subtilisin family serine protease